MFDDIYIRKANFHDIDEVFKLSNKDYVRKYSINKEKIVWENHVEWFTNMLHDNNKFFLVVSDNKDRFLGQIRFEINNDTAVVSISLSELIIGKGYSLALLRDSINKLFDEKRDVEIVIAYISENNITSDKLFIRAGFSVIDRKEEFLKYSLSRKDFSNDHR